MSGGHWGVQEFYHGVDGLKRLGNPALNAPFTSPSLYTTLFFLWQPSSSPNPVHHHHHCAPLSLCFLDPNLLPPLRLISHCTSLCPHPFDTHNSPPTTNIPAYTTSLHSPSCNVKQHLDTPAPTLLTEVTRQPLNSNTCVAIHYLAQVPPPPIFLAVFPEESSPESY